MSKNATTENTLSGEKLKIVNPNAAGIDIAATEMQICIPDDRVLTATVDLVASRKI